ncbi:RNA polymerase sigma-70 factor [Adhaeribacter swui]|uniref:RNA polymerase sigma-70 factor n=1 Tax=Adhaeribacter swui TaxID=2086471 RepID=A0A7G7G7T8_9BACT|nr:RNA polymerase sigma-70 factor [Adhaeribacter swui]QNF33222.1 RNA polymerase sigma-70 factor [Adhaeribacter swui]
MIATTAKHTSNHLPLKDLTDFDQVYRKYWSTLFDVAYQRVRSTEKAEEIIQDLFVELWEKREQIIIKESMEAYLFGALKFRVLNALRNEQVRTAHLQVVRNEAVTTTNSLEEEINKKDLEAAYQNQVNRLPEKCRAAFELSRQEQLSFKEIATQLNISVNTVEKHVGKALRALRFHLKDFTLTAFFIWFF